jgi:KAP family P-loop domain
MNFERSGNVRLSSDAPITDAKQDYFGFAAFAAALAEIVDNEQTDTPLTIALSAPWGAGKTSVARMMERDLAERVVERSGSGRRIVCHFNAWEHDDAPHLGAALAARVARVASHRRRRWRRLLQPLPTAMLDPRERWWRVVRLGLIAALLAAALAAFPPTREVAEDRLGLGSATAGVFGIVCLAAALWGLVHRAARNAAKFVDDPGSEAARGSIKEVKDQLGELIEQSTRGGRMVIVIDDLDRCPAERAVEVFEVASQLLAHDGVVTVLLADMRSLSKAASRAYGADAGDAEVGRQYLEKLVQLELDLPPPATEDMRLLLGNERPFGAPRETEKKEDEEVEERSGAERIGTRVAWIGAAVTAVSFSVETLTGLGPNDALTSGIFIGAAVGAVAMIWGGLYVSLDRHRRRRVAERVQTALKDNPDSISGDPEESESLLREAAGTERFESLARRVAESVRTVESPEVEAVEAFIKRYPPRFPRGAKRMLNHARLLTKIAREREMFGGEPELTPAHLGKWIVIGERWPAFAEQVTQDPRMIERFENPRKVDPTIESVGDEWGELEVLLKGEEPNLAGVIERLIYFRPASTAAPMEQAEPSSPAAVS